MCWGYNGYGQLGNNSATQSNVPVAVLGLASGVLQVAAGERHTCALTSTGAVDCWGDDSDGQLGNGTIGGQVYVQAPVMGLNAGVTAIAAGSYHTCALTQSKKTLCWGYNATGQLGDGTTTTQPAPVAVTGLPPGGLPGIVALGAQSSFAMTSAGPLLAWGNNGNGQLGTGNTTNQPTPTPIQ
jgi:alpha-tubulin suppressor-like RCC1 family protein